MRRHNDLHDYVHGLVVSEEKVASSAQSVLGLPELRILLGMEKQSTLLLGGPRTSSLKDHAMVAGKRKGPSLTPDPRNMAGKGTMGAGTPPSTPKTNLAGVDQYDRLIEFLVAQKVAGEVEYEGQVNNGDPVTPTWPRAALGVDSAGRRATPEEIQRQFQRAAGPLAKPMSTGGSVQKTSAEMALSRLMQKLALVQTHGAPPPRVHAAPPPIPAAARAPRPTAQGYSLASLGLQGQATAATQAAVRANPGLATAPAPSPAVAPTTDTGTRAPAPRADPSMLVDRNGPRGLGSTRATVRPMQATAPAPTTPLPAAPQSGGLFSQPSQFDFSGNTPGGIKKSSLDRLMLKLALKQKLAAITGASMGGGNFHAHVPAAPAIRPQRVGASFVRPMPWEAGAGRAAKGWM